MARSPGGKITGSATEDRRAQRPSRDAAGEQCARGAGAKGVQFQAVLEALSMDEEPETIERMCEAGAENYVLKTAPPEDLLAAIRGKASGPSSEQRRPADRVYP